MLQSLRLGFATNSSSSHSVILHQYSKNVPAGNHFAGDGDFGWDYLVLDDVQSKLQYLISQNQFQYC